MGLWIVLAAAIAAEPPKIEECFLVTPSIAIGAAKADAGPGFIIEHDGRLLLLPSAQVAGPAGGLAEQLSADAVKKGFSLVVARDGFNRKECSRGTAVLDIASAPMGDHGKDDILAFELTPSKSALDSVSTKLGSMHPGKLAQSAPKKDDPVFVASRSAAETRVLAAKVGEVTDRFIFYEFVGAPDLVGTVGGPLLNAAGEVVGIHVGMGQFEDGTLFGSANPLPAVKAKLAAKALPAATPTP